MSEKDKGPVIGLSWHPTLPTLSSSTTKNIKTPDEAESSSALWKPNSQLVDGLFVPPNDPIKLNKLRKSQRKDTLGKGWYVFNAKLRFFKKKNYLENIYELITWCLFFFPCELLK